MLTKKIEWTQKKMEQIDDLHYDKHQSNPHTNPLSALVPFSTFEKRFARTQASVL